MTGQDRTVMDRMVQHSSEKKYFRVVHNYQKFSTLFIYAQILCLFSYNDNPEITEMVQFLDPETAKILHFLDPEIVKMDQKISGSRNRRNGAVSGSRNCSNTADSGSRNRKN